MRLIDADNINWDKCEDADGNPVYVLDKRDIDKQPTAYDVDKVVGELENLNNKGSVTKTEKLITKATVNKAIEIVKAGVNNGI